MSRVRDNPLYGRWNMIKQRCNNATNNKFHVYGGRGISICPEWEDFHNFEKWALKNGFKGHLTIDRIDTNGNYEPSNCRWVDQRVQQNNRRNNRMIVYKNKEYTLSELSRMAGLDSETLAVRLSSGMSVNDAVSKPLHYNRIMVSVDGVDYSLLEKCSKLNLPYKTIYARVKRGWSTERALNTPVRKGNYRRNVQA